MSEATENVTLSRENGKAEKAEEALSHIPGWLFQGEAHALAELAGGKVVLEIGSYCGRSTVAMAARALQVYAIDWHRGDPDTEQATGERNKDTLAEFRKHTFDKQNVIALVGSVEMMTVLGESFADMAFVDGQHDQESVERDTKFALRCLKDGGTLALHDWNRESVKVGFKAAMAGRQFEIERVVDLTCIVKNIRKPELKITPDLLALFLEDLAKQQTQWEAQAQLAKDTMQAIHGSRQAVMKMLAWAAGDADQSVRDQLDQREAERETAAFAKDANAEIARRQAATPAPTVDQEEARRRAEHAQRIADLRQKAAARKRG